jgi:hypothetical protein
LIEYEMCSTNRHLTAKTLRVPRIETERRLGKLDRPSRIAIVRLKQR